MFVMEMFRMKNDRGKRTDWTPFLDGQWRVLDFGDTDEPGVSWRANLNTKVGGPQVGRISALRWWAKRRGYVVRQMTVQIPDKPFKVQLCARFMTTEQYLDEVGCAVGPDGLV